MKNWLLLSFGLLAYANYGSCAKPEAYGLKDSLKYFVYQTNSGRIIVTIFSPYIDTIKIDKMQKESFISNVVFDYFYNGGDLDTIRIRKTPTLSKVFDSIKILNFARLSLDTLSKPTFIRTCWAVCFDNVSCNWIDERFIRWIIDNRIEWVGTVSINKKEWDKMNILLKGNFGKLHVIIH